MLKEPPGPAFEALMGAADLDVEATGVANRSSS